MSLILFFFIIYSYRINRIKIINQQLESRVEQRTKELSNSLQNLESKNRLIQDKNDELTTISQNLHNTNSELDKSNKIQNRLLSIFAHDIKNPFSSILIQNKNLLDEYNNLNDDKRINEISKIYISTQKIYKH